MSDLWQIEGAEGIRSLTGWGVTSAILTRRSYAADTLDFRIDQEDALQEALFPYGSTLKLRRNGAIVFIGKITREQAIGGQDGEAHGYTAANVWHDLERLVYQQTRCLSQFTEGGYIETLTPHVVLGQTPFGGSYLTTTAQMLEVVLYAIGKGVVMAPGAIAGGAPFSREEGQSLTCAEVLRRLGALTPDSVMWVDYSSGAQVLHYGRRAGLVAVDYNLTAGDAVADFRIEKRQDLVPSGVRFIFIRSETSDSDGRTYTQATIQEAGLPDQPGGLIAEIAVMGSGTEREAPIPGNLAAEYYLSLQTAPYEGQLVTQGRDVRGDLWPRHVLNCTNGRAAWATMRAVVQQTTENLLTGESVVEFGPAERLVAQDFVDQLLFVRRARPSTNLQAVRTCKWAGPDIDDEGPVAEDEPQDNEDAGVDPAAYDREQDRANATNGNPAEGHSTVDLDACEDGVAVTFRVLGRRVG